MEPATTAPSEEKETIKVTSKELVHKGRFTSYYNYHFVNPRTQHDDVWETVVRNNHISPNGAKVVAIAHRTGAANSLIIIASYRIPLESWILEFPSGINDSGDIGECATRELREETGYTGKPRITSAGFPTYTDCWKSDNSTAFIVVDVDLDDPANIAPKQKLESEENIKVMLIPMKGLAEELLRVAEKGKFKICASLWSFALGLSMSHDLLCSP